jgi:hypothetical protein
LRSNPFAQVERVDETPRLLRSIELEAGLDQVTRWCDVEARQSLNEQGLMELKDYEHVLAEAREAQIAKGKEFIAKSEERIDDARR